MILAMVLLAAACIDLSAQRPLLRQRCDAEFFIIRQQRGVPLDGFDFDRRVESNENADEIMRGFAGELREPVEVLLAFNESGDAVGFVELSIRAGGIIRRGK